ncbi:MAG: nicotinamide riboside transporter PnuC [Oscillospiraceae bacterium]
MKLKNPFSRLTGFELGLWITSMAVVIGSFLLAGEYDPLSLAAPLIGVTSLIFIARGEPAGQVLTILFSLLYAIISWKCRYYGEMITYLGMTAPSALAALIVWLKHPFQQGKPQVVVSHLTPKKLTVTLLLTAVVTAGFYFVLKFFNTAQLPVSTVSVTTSFLASALMVLRSPLYALAYAANDIVLIVLWLLASMENISDLPMVFCFAAFLANDIYGFINWRRIRKTQAGKS